MEKMRLLFIDHDLPYIKMSFIYRFQLTFIE